MTVEKFNLSSYIQPGWRIANFTRLTSIPCFNPGQRPATDGAGLRKFDAVRLGAAGWCTAVARALRPAVLPRVPPLRRRRLPWTPRCAQQSSSEARARGSGVRAGAIRPRYWLGPSDGRPGATVRQLRCTTKQELARIGNPGPVCPTWCPGEMLPSPQHILGAQFSVWPALAGFCSPPPWL